MLIANAIWAAWATWDLPGLEIADSRLRPDDRRSGLNRIPGHFAGTTRLSRRCASPLWWHLAGRVVVPRPGGMVERSRGGHDEPRGCTHVEVDQPHCAPAGESTRRGEPTWTRRCESHGRRDSADRASISRLTRGCPAQLVRRLRAGVFNDRSGHDGSRYVTTQSLDDASLFAKDNQTYIAGDGVDARTWTRARTPAAGRFTLTRHKSGRRRRAPAQERV